jgi:hypothetical protein
MMRSGSRSAADQYAACVEAVLAQRTRLRGTQPPGDLFGGFPADHPLMTSDPHRLLDANLEIIASYVEADDVIIDVGGGAGRVSLPLATRCKEVINIDPSPVMGAGFAANASKGGVANTRFIAGDWLDADSPIGTLALVNHVTYLTRDIVPFVRKLEKVGRRRVIITVNSPPPPSWQRKLFELVHGEAEAIVPGQVELVNVLWELGILPDVLVLPRFTANPIVPAPTKRAAIDRGVAGFGGDQWALWPLGSELEERVRTILEERFEELYGQEDAGFVPRWITPGREILITWPPTEQV